MSSLKKILECPVCLTIVRTAPVPTCHSGHIVCPSCWNLTHLCPLCRVKLHESEKCFSQTANTLLQLVILPCQYQDEGCSARGASQEMENHGKECIFRTLEHDLGTPSGCSTPGCAIGRKRRVKSKIVFGSRFRGAMRVSSPSFRQHCDCVCNRVCQ